MKSRVFVGIGLLVILASFVGMFLFSLESHEGQLASIPGMMVAYIGGLLVSYGRRLNTPPLPALSDVEGQPVVFFRSFSDDGGVYPFITIRNAVGLVETYEGVLTRILRKMGPPVAIGRPGEDAPELGAGRIYVDDDEWKEVAQEMIRRAALVIITVGKTPGVRWEIEHVLEGLPPERLIFFFPPRVKRFQWMPDGFIAVLTFFMPLRLLLLKDDRKKRYACFVGVAKAPLAAQNPDAVLPKKIGNNVLMSFNDDWTPRLHSTGQVIPFTGPVLERTLAPIQRRLLKARRQTEKRERAS